MPSPSTEGGSPPAPWLSNITFHGLLGSLTPLVPMPFLDDWAERWVHRRLVRETLRLRGFEAELWHLEVLVWDGDLGQSRGCLYPLVLAFKLVLYVLKKIFRKLLIFLLVKDCVDHFSSAFHQGYLLHVAFERGVVDAQALAGGERLIAVRQAILTTCEAVDARPIDQLVRRVLLKSRRALLSTARLFGRLLRRERRQSASAESPDPQGDANLQSEKDALRGVVEQMSNLLWSNTAYRAELERVFAVALAARLKPPPELT